MALSPDALSDAWGRFLERSPRARRPVVWPRCHVSSLLKGLHQAPPARPPCARPAPPPGRRHVVTAEAGAGRVAGGTRGARGRQRLRGGGGTGRGWGVRGPAHVTDAEVLLRSPPLVARRRLEACLSIFLCISNYTLGRIPANCCGAAFRMLPHRHDCGVAAGPASLPRAQCPEAPHCEPWAQTALAARFLPLDPQEKVLCLLRVCSPRCSSSAS